MNDRNAVAHATALQKRALRPNVTRDDALRMLRSPWRPKLRSVAQIWIPFLVYRARITNGATVTTEQVAVDAVSGALDVLLLERVDDEATIEAAIGRNHVPARLAPEDGAALAVEKLRRAIFTRGFFRVRELGIEPQFADLLLYVPYWAGFHGSGSDPRVRVIDAVRRRFEGAKVRTLLEEWIAGN